ncbi:hypothetical protein DVK85_01330 [Flavobacterium arcticum]|uniref:Uncharacterized protein n=2 Tax=Flavobacterium arcticum TaxID=1784713 RepID=A0A345H8N4_9FLAO|nr:hypothetical protein DVK85_01330 [Flavobacterium arcticum]
MLGAEMEAEAGSVDKYFDEKIYHANIKKFGIKIKRKNGSGWKVVEPVHYFNLSKNNNQPMHNQPAPVHNTQPNPFDMGQLMGGLNIPDVLYKTQHYPTLLLENQDLKVENKELKKTVADLEREALKKEFDINQKANNGDMWLKALDYAPALMAAMKGSVPAIESDAGLASASNLSAVKQQLIQEVQGTSDGVSSYILLALKGINTKEGFGEALEQLLVNHNLIPNT